MCYITSEIQFKNVQIMLISLYKDIKIHVMSFKNIKTGLNKPESAWWRISHIMIWQLILQISTIFFVMTQLHVDS